MNASALASRNGSSPFGQAWLQQSVQEFFSGINWDNAPQDIYELSQELTASALQGTELSLSLNLTVSQFFAAIPWDGTAIAAPATPVLADPLSGPEDLNDLTLEGFSDLFG
jgi:hypothetical protein